MHRFEFRRLGFTAAFALLSVSGTGLGIGMDAVTNPDVGVVKPAPAAEPMVRVIARFRNSPWAPLMRAERERLEPLLAPLSEEIQEIHRSTRPAASLSPAEEAAWLDGVKEGRNAVPADKAARREQLAAQIEALQAEARRRVREQVQEAVAPEHEALARLVEQLGGKVVGRSIGLSALTIEIPESAAAKIAADPLVWRIEESPVGNPALDVSVASLGVPGSFWANNRLGQTWDVGVMDSGCQQNHPAFAGVNFDAAPGAGTTDTHPAGSTGTIGHGTHVSGIITSRHATNRGVAPGLDTLLVGRADNSFAAHTDWMVTTAADDPEAINLSFEFGVATADDSEIEQFVDAIVDDFECAMIVAAGNEGGLTNTLTRPSVARNVICVGNMNDRGTVSRSDDRLSGSSGHGPVPVSGRRKPDLVAPGFGITSANVQWQTGSDYVARDGTSMAAPHATGGYLLVLQTRGDQTPIANKAVLINAADAWTENGTDADYTDDVPFHGSHWNNAYGWGSLNLGSAYFNATDVFERVLSTSNASPNNPSERLFYGTLYNGEKATLVWNRSMVYNGTMVPPNITTTADLDLRLYRQSDGALVSTSLSSVDNVEQVGLNAAPVQGDAGTPVVIRMTLDTPNRVVSCALATEENFAETAGPALEMGLLTTQCSPGSNFFMHVAVTNSGDVPAHNVIVTLDPPPAGWSVGVNATNVGTILAGQTRYALFFVTAPCNAGQVGAFSFVAGSSSYGRQFSATGSGNITINPSSAMVNDVPQLVLAGSGSATRSFGIIGTDFQVVAARSAGAVWGLSMGDSGVCFSPDRAASLSGGPIDLLISNAHHASVPGSGTMHVRFELGTAVNLLGNARIEYQSAIDVAGSAQVFTMEPEEVVQIYERQLVAGRRYTMAADVLSGSPELALRMYPPGTTYGNGGTAAITADSGGLGGSERAAFIAGSDGAHAFVVTKSNFAPGDVRFIIACGADFNLSGNVSVQDVFDFLDAYFSGNAAADFNLSGAQTVQDVFDFLSAYFSGC